MKCGACGLENPPSAKVCDCGYPFDGAVPFVQMAATRWSLTPGPPRVLHAGMGALRFVWLLPLFGAIAGGADIVLSWDSAKSAPQQTALAGFVLACAIIPYCFARAVIGLAGKG